MPVTMEIREDGRVLLLIYTDPVTMQEIGDGFPANLAHRNRTPHTVHTLFDFSHFQHPPAELMRARYSPVFTHPRSGQMVVFGANLAVQGIVLRAAEFTRNANKVHFFDTETEAWQYIRTAITQDHQAEGGT